MTIFIFGRTIPLNCDLNFDSISINLDIYQVDFFQEEKTLNYAVNYAVSW